MLSLQELHRAPTARPGAARAAPRASDADASRRSAAGALEVARARERRRLRRARARRPRRAGARARASSTCSPRPSAGAAGRTSARSCRARSRCLRCRRRRRCEFLLEDVGPGTDAAVRAASRATGCWVLGPLGAGFAPPRDGRRRAAVRRRRRHRAAGDLQDALLGAGARARAARLPRRGARARGAGLLRDAAGGDRRRLASATTGSSPSCWRPSSTPTADAVVYACGPPPMLEAVRALCAEREVPGPARAGVRDGLRLRRLLRLRRADRGGGYVRLCVDGPGARGRARSAAVPAPEHGHGRASAGSSSRTRSSTARAPSTRSPRGARSATRCSSDFPFARSSPRRSRSSRAAGNPPPRLWETPAGLINSIGLPNKGLGGYLDARPARAGRAARCR